MVPQENYPLAGQVKMVHPLIPRPPMYPEYLQRTASCEEKPPKKKKKNPDVGIYTQEIIRRRPLKPATIMAAEAICAASSWLYIKIWPSQTLTVLALYYHSRRRTQVPTLSSMLCLPGLIHVSAHVAAATEGSTRQFQPSTLLRVARRAFERGQTSFLLEPRRITIYGA